MHSNLEALKFEKVGKFKRKIQNSPSRIQQYMMSMMMDGERDIEAGRANEGCSKIAMGIAHMPAQQVQMVFMQLAQTLPANIVQNVKARYYPAKARVQTKMMEEMMERQKAARERAQQSALEKAKENDGPVIQEIAEAEQKPVANNDEPDDVDSIDGDESHSVEVEMKETEQAEQFAKPEAAKAISEEIEDVDSLDGDEPAETPAGEELAEAIELGIEGQMSVKSDPKLAQISTF